MYRTMLKSMIHRATVTQAEVDLPGSVATGSVTAASVAAGSMTAASVTAGSVAAASVAAGSVIIDSVTIDEDLMDAADLLAGERVAIVDVTNGARLESHAVPGRRGSGVLAVHGAAARLVERGDVVIVTSYAIVDEARARTVGSRVVLVDAHNRQRDLVAEPATSADTEPPGPAAAETDDAARLDALIQAGA